MSLVSSYGSKIALRVAYSFSFASLSKLKRENKDLTNEWVTLN